MGNFIIIKLLCRELLTAFAIKLLPSSFLANIDIYLWQTGRYRLKNHFSFKK